MKKQLLNLFILLGMLLTSVGAWGDDTYTLLDGGKTLKITTDGDMMSYSSSSKADWNTTTNVTNVTKIIIGNTVKSVGKYAFYGFSNVTTVQFGESSPDKKSIVASIGTNAFSGCTGVTAIYFYGSSISDWMGISFANYPANPMYGATNSTKFYLNSTTSALTTLDISDVETINNYVFYGCASLTKVTLGSGVVNIGNQVFSGCTGITTLTIGKDVKKIGTKAFEGCTNVSTVNYNATELTTIPTSSTQAFYNVGSNKTTVTLNVGENVTAIPANLFYPSLSGGPSVTVSGRAKITQVKFAENSKCTSIGASAFGYVSALTTITLPESIQSIGNYAFTNCTGLTAFNIEATQLPTLGTNPFSAVTVGNVALSVPASAMGDYAADATWSKFKSIVALPYGYCGAEDGGKNLKWSISGSGSYVTLTISGSGRMEDYDNSTNKAPWADKATTITSLSMPIGITRIGKYAFNGLSKITSVTIYTSVKEIGAHAFYGCNGLSSGSVSYRKDNATYSSTTYAHDWAQIDFEDSYSNPSYYARKIALVVGGNKSEAITSASLTGIPEIKPYAFYNCSTITSVTLGPTVERVGKSAFAGCIGLQTVTCNAESVPTCGSAFANAANATLVVPCESREAYKVAPYWKSFGTIKPFVVTYDLNGQGDEFTECVAGTAAVKPEDPTTTGYDFAGWYTEAACTNSYDFATTVTGDLILYAKWTAKQYDIHYTFNGGSMPTINSQYDVEANYKYTYGVAKTLNTSTTRTGYTFGGWYAEEDFSGERIYEIPVGTYGDVYYYAKWIPNTYTVTYDLQGHGDAITPVEVEYASLITEPTEPAESYYVFGGWYKESTCENPWNFAANAMPNRDLTLYAKWTKQTAIELSDEEDNSAKLAAFNGETVDVQLTRTLKEGMYNTICLPFALDADQIEAAFGAGTDIAAPTSSSLSGDEFTVEFTQGITSIAAGVPYLIKPTVAVTNPEFAGVTLDATIRNTTTTYVNFIGLTSKTWLAADPYMRLVGTGNVLYTPSAAGDMKGMRAYFMLNPSVPVSARGRIVMHENTTTGMINVNDAQRANDNDNRVRKVLRNGQVVILRGDKVYNLQGVAMESL